MGVRTSCCRCLHKANRSHCSQSINRRLPAQLRQACLPFNQQHDVIDPHAAGGTGGAPSWRRAYDAATAGTAAVETVSDGGSPGDASTLLVTAHDPEGAARSVEPAQDISASIADALSVDTECSKSCALRDPRCEWVQSQLEVHGSSLRYIAMPQEKCQSVCLARTQKSRLLGKNQITRLVCVLAGQSVAAAGDDQSAGQADAAAADQPEDAAVSSAAAGQLQFAGTEAGTLPSVAGSAVQHPDGQPAGGASETAAESAAEQQTGQLPDAGLSGGAAAELELPAQVMAPDEPAAQIQAADTASQGTGAQHDPSIAGAAAAQLPVSAADAAGSGEDPRVVAAANEALAAVQAAALGISDPQAAGPHISDSGSVGAKQAVVKPAAASGIAGGVSDEDLAAEAAEVRRRREMQWHSGAAATQSRLREA